MPAEPATMLAIKKAVTKTLAMTKRKVSRVRMERTPGTGQSP